MSVHVARRFRRPNAGEVSAASAADAVAADAVAATGVVVALTSSKVRELRPGSDSVLTSDSFIALSWPSDVGKHFLQHSENDSCFILESR